MISTTWNCTVFPKSWQGQAVVFVAAIVSSVRRWSLHMYLFLLLVIYANVRREKKLYYVLRLKVTWVFVMISVRLDVRKNLKQSWLPAFRRRRNVKNTQEVKRNAVELDKTRQNSRIFQEVLLSEVRSVSCPFPSASIQAPSRQRISNLIVC